ncbi:T9SS type A sorting domain-containing protein [Winogradskyella sp. 3972H.M.0a.05]|uniref:T9SS type A sorting domain-containing protein n=1 Tax=Winogradskyella sp. 3972H.M.0a.05 TaxID=2950277 RepID=UPI003394E035
MKIKITLYVMSFFFALTISAQSNTVSAGGDATGSNGSVSYSIGQVSYMTVSSGSGFIIEGLQQPFIEPTLSTGPINTINLLAKVYPNPTINHIELDLGDQVLDNLMYQVMDNTGKLLLSKNITSKTTKIHLDDYAASTYFLSVMQGTRLFKTFKIIKQ